MFRGSFWHRGGSVEYGCCRGAECGCGGGPGGPGYWRHYPTAAERLDVLEAYLKDLEAEAAGVRETLSRLRGGQPPAPGTPA